ncbi:MAG: MFS transporter, partial [Steroidobacteraceae bacterium]
GLTYLGEIRTNWRFLGAAAIGTAAGYSLVNYVGNIFTPHLIKQFNWSKAELALIGVTTLCNIVAQPIAGRLADAYGVRLMATIGVVITPLVFVGLSLMTGSFLQFFVLSLLQVVVVGGTTTTVIYSRLIARQFDRARGISLAIAACTAPAAAAAFVPSLSHFIDVNGWRAGYLILALCTAVAGVIAIVLIPAGTDRRRGIAVADHTRASSYGVVVRSRAFQLIAAGTLLCNLSFTLQTSQLKVILLDRGIASTAGSLAISLFATSVVVGRLLCGVALDRFPAYIVAAVSLGIPAIGLGALASGSAAPILVAGAVLTLGLSLGAEGDVLAYLIMKYFNLATYSTALGMVLGSLALSITIGSLLLSVTLKLSGSFVPFLLISGVSVLAASGMFMMLGRTPRQSAAAFT